MPSNQEWYSVKVNIAALVTVTAPWEEEVSDEAAVQKDPVPRQSEGLPLLSSAHRYDFFKVALPGAYISLFMTDGFSAGCMILCRLFLHIVNVQSLFMPKTC